MDRFGRENVQKNPIHPHPLHHGIQIDAIRNKSFLMKKARTRQHLLLPALNRG